jgi:signal peptidase I
MLLRWFLSKAVREAFELRKQVWIILNSQRDQLSAKAIAEVTTALEGFRASLAGARDRQAVQAVAGRLEETAAKWLKPYPNAGTRENIKEFLVSGVLILTIFNFFVQPMKIPSGSAQPTLYGNVVTNLKGQEAPVVPAFWGKLRDWFRGIDYHLWIAKEDGRLEMEPVQTVAGFIKIQRFRVGQDTCSFYWPPDNLERLCGAVQGQAFRKGDTVLKLKIASGDRLFIDRLTYNFRRPQRGEVIVFTSTGIDGLIQNTHYIKRLIAWGGEKVRIGDDRHVVVNNARLDNQNRHFEFVYAFHGPPKDSVYSGHVNDKVGRQYDPAHRSLAPLFPDGNTEFTVRPQHLLAFGDNTMNSFDGRAWGDFPERKAVGRALFVFWPLTTRFGLVWW